MSINRKLLLEALGTEPRSISDLAAQFGATRKDVQDALPHVVRSARAAGRQLVIVPAKCRDCEFMFDESKLSKPSRCPNCRGTWIYEPLVGTKS